MSTDPIAYFKYTGAGKGVVIFNLNSRDFPKYVKNEDYQKWASAAVDPRAGPTYLVRFKVRASSGTWITKSVRGEAFPSTALDSNTQFRSYPVDISDVLEGKRTVADAYVYLNGPGININVSKTLLTVDANPTLVKDPAVVVHKPYKAPACPKDSTEFGGYCCYNWNKLPGAQCTSKWGSGATKLRGLLTKDVACPAGTVAQGGACVRAPAVKPVVKPAVKPVVKCSDPKMPRETKALNGKIVCCPSGTASAFFKGDGYVCCPEKLPHAYNGTCHRCPQSAPVDVNGTCMNAANAAIAKQNIAQKAAAIAAAAKQNAISVKNARNATIAMRNAANAKKQPAKFAATVGPTSVAVTVTEPIEHTVTLDGPNGNLTRKITGPGSFTFAGLLQDTEFKITVVAPNRRAMQTTRRTTSNAKPSASLLAVEAAARKAAAEAAARKAAAEAAARKAAAEAAARKAAAETAARKAAAEAVARKAAAEAAAKRTFDAKKTPAPTIVPVFAPAAGKKVAIGSVEAQVPVCADPRNAWACSVLGGFDS